MKAIILTALAGILAAAIAVLGTLAFVKSNQAKGLTDKLAKVSARVKESDKRIKALEDQIAELEDQVRIAQSATGNSAGPQMSCGPAGAAPVQTAATDDAGTPLEFRYKPGVLKITNLGESIQIEAAPGSTLKIGNESHDLTHYSFQRLPQADGKPAVPAMLLLHRSATGRTIAVIVTMRDSAFQNRSLWLIWNNVPPKAGAEAKMAGISIDPTTLLPATYEYQVFEGALPVPPCTPNTRFYRLKAPLGVTREQAEKIPGPIPMLPPAAGAPAPAPAAATAPAAAPPAPPAAAGGHGPAKAAH